MPNDTTAYSIDGRSFTFRSPVDSHLRAGAYVSVRSDAADRLGQILQMRAVPGPTFGEPLVEGSGSLLPAEGEPFTAATVEPADPAVVKAHLIGTNRTGLLELGRLIDVEGVPAILGASGLGRHTFVCGQSGSGKTYAMGRLLERILLDTDLRIVILDPNSDYSSLGEILPRDATDMDVEDYQRVDRRHAEVRDGVRVLGAGSGLRLWLGNLTLRQQAAVLGLDPLRDAEEVDLAQRLVDELSTTRYTPFDIARRAGESSSPAAERLRLRIGNLGLDRMEIWADEDNPGLEESVGDDWRVAVMDVGSLQTPTEQSIISAAVVGTLWQRRRDRNPVLLVIDEAHNICPQDPTNANQALATEHLVTIAGEGRKYGIYLMLATQRPTKIHENVLSQCDNLILMRMNSEHDIARLASAFSSVPQSLIERSSSFQLGEGLAYGKIAPDPLLFKTSRRVTPEGGTDVPTDWIRATV